MVLTEVFVPSVEDARAAAAAVGAVDRLVRVALFGSVARGEATERSDIDLLVVFDDIDYEQRTRHLCEIRAAVGACGLSDGVKVNPKVTDVSEWAQRVAMNTSFERSISVDLIDLWTRVAPAADLGKPMAKETTDLNEAGDRLTDAAAAAYELAMLLSAPSLRDSEFHLTSKLRAILARVHTGCEVLLKALTHLQGEHPPARTHQIQELIDGLSDDGTTEQVTKILDPLRVIYIPVEDQHEAPDAFTNWRIHGIYHGEGDSSALYLTPQRCESYLDAFESLAKLIASIFDQRRVELSESAAEKLDRLMTEVNRLSECRAANGLTTGTPEPTRPA